MVVLVWYVWLPPGSRACMQPCMHAYILHTNTPIHGCTHACMRACPEIYPGLSDRPDLNRPAHTKRGMRDEIRWYMTNIYDNIINIIWHIIDCILPRPCTCAHARPTCAHARPSLKKSGSAKLWLMLGYNTLADAWDATVMQSCELVTQLCENWMMKQAARPLAPQPTWSNLPPSHLRLCFGRLSLSYHITYKHIAYII